MSKNAIVSFANSRGNYVKSLARLSESLRNNAAGIDFLGYIGEASIGAPPHFENPYAFKIYCLQKAIAAGYENILWLDSSCFAIKSVQPIFDEISELGLIFQDAGYFADAWTNDYTLAYFGITRDQASKMKLIGNAGFLGFNIKSSLGATFFLQWTLSMEDGLFKGEWTNEDLSQSVDSRCLGHRHDLSCSSIILNQMGIIHMAKSGEEILQYAGIFDATLNETIILKAQGL